MVEVLGPTRLDISEEFARGFDGLSAQPVALDDLLQACEDLTRIVVRNTPVEHRRVLLSIKQGEPDWTPLGLPGVELLPAVRWPIENLKKNGRGQAGSRSREAE
jgi:hypothetical protein